MSNEVEAWVQRFRVLDKQEEEVVDDSVQYRALLVHGREEQAPPHRSSGRGQGTQAALKPFGGRQ
jgi:hypothetical protein